MSSQLCVNFDRSWSVRSAHYRRGGKKLLDDKTLASRRKRWWRVQSVTRNNEETIVHVQNRKNAFPEWDECRERLVFFVAAMDLVDVGFQDRLDTNNEAAKEMWIADAWHRPQSTSGIIDRLLQIQIVCLPSFLGLSTRTVFERCPSQACFDSIGYITLESFRIYFVIVVPLFFYFCLFSINTSFFIIKSSILVIRATSYTSFFFIKYNKYVIAIYSLSIYFKIDYFPQEILRKEADKFSTISIIYHNYSQKEMENYAKYQISHATPIFQLDFFLRQITRKQWKLIRIIRFLSTIA